MTITVHCMVKNEEYFIWYAIMSVTDYVDRVIVFDTGSTDKTVDVIHSINNSKINFYEFGPVDQKEHTNLRQKMIDMTDTDWFMILDSDEVWPEDQIQTYLSLTKELDNQKINACTACFIPCVGDIYHYNPIGQYTIAGIKQNHTLRLYNHQKKLKWVGDYNQDVITTQEGESILKDTQSIYLAKQYFFHLTHLARSSNDDRVWLRQAKRVSTYSKGPFRKIPSDIRIPSIFFNPHPLVVPTITAPMPIYVSIKNRLLSIIFRKILRRGV
jgi:glycosyltransferase involved in cell wall biosynthesis